MSFRRFGVSFNAAAGSSPRPNVRRDGKPAQLRGEACAGVDLDERTDLHLAVVVDRAEHAAVADGLSNHEGVRPVVQEGDVEGGATVCVVELGGSQRAVFQYREDGQTVGVWSVRRDRLERNTWVEADCSPGCALCSGRGLALLRWRWVAIGVDPADAGAHGSLEKVAGDGIGQVCIGARIEGSCDQTVGRAIAGYENWNVSDCADQPNEPVATELGHGEVHYDHVGIELENSLEAQEGSLDRHRPASAL